MSLFSIFEISGSALAAQSQRMNLTASNLANADSVTGPDGQPYRARHAIFESLAQQNGIGGVQVREVVEDQNPPRLVYQPGHPLADAQGYVAMPNVDPLQEMVDMIAASRSYQANVEVLNTNRELLLKTLTLGEN
jgi:flagellar basal-body rod protein FlgC